MLYFIQTTIPKTQRAPRRCSFAISESRERMNEGAGRYGTHRGAFEKNKKKIYQTQRVCGICGKPVDFNLKYPSPLAPCIDHIIPISKGGHPSDIENMQLAHWTCNRQKSDKLTEKKMVDQNADVISNRILPHSLDWKNFNARE